MKVRGKVIVLTGAGSGIGRELAIQLCKLGARVAMVDIDEEGMKETASLCSQGSTSTHRVNIAHRAEVEELPEQVIQEFGQIDGIINNAGIIQAFVDVNSLDYESIQRVMDINFSGTLYMCKSFLPYLLLRPEAHIVNVSSMGGFIPFPKQTIYGASKAAVKLLTEGLYAELKESSVRVTVVHPGAVNTHIMSNSGLASREEEEQSKSDQGQKALAADKAANQIIRGMENNKFRVLVGKDARMLDTLYRIMPRKAVEIITKQMSNLGM